MKKLLLCLGALALSQCRSPAVEARHPDALAFCDFESLIGWLPDDALHTLSRERAHSGRYALKVDGRHDYSLGFNSALNQLSDTRLGKVRISAWVLRTDEEADAKLVVTLTDPAHPDQLVLWQALDLTKAVRPANEWVAVSKTVALPPTVSGSFRLTTYMWRPAGNGQPVYLDDIEISQAP